MKPMLWFTTAMLVGCSSWPEFGSGGGERQGLMAEPSYLYALDQSRLSGLLAQAEVLDAHVELLKVQGAQRCIPASVQSLEQQGTRVRQQLGAKLAVDAASDLAAYQLLLRQVKQRFDLVRQQTQCVESDHKLAQTEAAFVGPVLLFSVMFETGKAELSLGYQRQLQFIASSVRDCRCEVAVIGHTDAEGTVDANTELATRRVEVVRRSLEQAGLTVSDQLALGEQELLLNLDKSEPHNRRVDLYIRASRVNTKVQSSWLPVNQWQDHGVLPLQ